MITQTANRLVSDSRSRPPSGLESRNLNKPAGLLRLNEAEKILGPGEPLFWEGDSAIYVYRVKQGVVRNYRLLDNGRRQIEAFRFPGDIFGLDGGPIRSSSADAIDDVRLAVGRRDAILARSAVDCDEARELCAVTSRELDRVKQHSLLLPMRAHERVACFLLEMSTRFDGTNMLDLPMSRQDIADYLGLTIETVSRAIAQFQSTGLIGLRTSRRIMLRDVGELEHMCE